MPCSRRTFLAVPSLAAIASYAGATSSALAQERLQAVATFSILGDLVQNVSLGAIDLTVIVGPNGDPHTFEPNPEQIAALADADLIFENGIGFEPWLDDMYEASGSTAQRVAVTDGIALLALDEADEHEHDEHEEDGEHEDEHTSDDGHEHGEHDPHVWHDVANAVLMVQVIRDTLVNADPDNAATYVANSDAFVASMVSVDDTIRAMVETVPPEQRILVTTHDSLGYFAHAYGFTIAGTALGSVSTEAADPSAGEIADLIDQIKATGVPAIFAENIENADLMQQIADDAGVVLAPPLYTDALSEPDGDAPTYLSLLIWNTTTIVESLSGATA